MGNNFRITVQRSRSATKSTDATIAPNSVEKMKLSRTNRFGAICIALFSMLFMQFAVASYVCPGTGMRGVQPQNSQAISAIDRLVMTGCDDMDADQPVLCHVQGKGDVAKQPLGKMQLADIPPVAWLGTAIILTTAETDQHRHIRLSSPDLLSRASAPPLSILNCCFRI